MFLKHLINPRPTIIISFIVFCILFTCLPLLNSSLELIFSHQLISPFFVFLCALLLPAFNALGINNLVYEKNVIRKDNLVLGFVFIMLCSPFVNAFSESIISFFLLFFFKFHLGNLSKRTPIFPSF